MIKTLNSASIGRISILFLMEDPINMPGKGKLGAGFKIPVWFSQPTSGKSKDKTEPVTLFPLAVTPSSRLVLKLLRLLSISSVRGDRLIILSTRGHFYPIQVSSTVDDDLVDWTGL